MSPASLATRQQSREQVCTLWQQGKCTAGSSCLFAHGPQPPEPDDAPRVAGGSGKSSSSRSDQSAAGSLGAALTGADQSAVAALASGPGRPSQEVGAALTGADQSAAAALASGPGRPSQVCTLWQQGNCTAGSSCLFAHGPQAAGGSECSSSRQSCADQSEHDEELGAALTGADQSAAAALASGPGRLPQALRNQLGGVRPDDAPRVAGGSGKSSSSRSWADQSEHNEEPGAALCAGADRGAFAALAGQPPQAPLVPFLEIREDVPSWQLGVCRAWQLGCCAAGSSCLFQHDVGLGPAVLEHSSDMSSSRTWTAWSGQSLSQDGRGDPAPSAGAGQPAEEPAQQLQGHHWVWGSSRSRSGSSSASQSRHSLRCAAHARQAPEAHGAVGLPSFNDHMDLPEFVPGSVSPRDRGPLPPQLPPASRSAKRRRERKNNEKRRDMKALNEVMVQQVGEALGSLSLARTVEARRRQFSSALPPEQADSPEAAAPPPTPRWKIDRVLRPGEEEDLDGADSQ